MGTLTRIALLCLGLAGLGLGLECNIGSVNIDANGKIQKSSIHSEPCAGVCTRRSPKMADGSTVHIFNCEDRQHAFQVDEVCLEDLCNRVPGLDAEIQIEEPIRPVVNFTCYSGIQIGTQTIAGGLQPCDGGTCALATTSLGQYNGTMFFCLTHAVCDALLGPAPDGTQNCGIVNAHPDYNTSLCCCYDSANCNLQGYPNIPVPSPIPPSTRIPQACYSGIHIAGIQLTQGGYVACQGDCSVFSFKYQGQYDFSMYGCDPTNVCQQVNLQNDCLDLNNGTMGACCCNYDACIDPTVTPPRYPNGTREYIMECYVGVHIVNQTSGNALDAGASMACDGMCGRLKTTVNGFLAEAFYCASNPLCYALDNVGQCTNLTFAGMGAETCCCYDSPNCNTNNTDITPVPPTQIPRTDMIACFTGLHVDNISIAESYVGCGGDCASLTLQSTIMGNDHNLTLYLCDPATVCQTLGITNRCAQIPGTIFSGCCCDSDVCINPYQRRFPNGTNSLMCGVGVTINGNENFTDVYQMPCDGKCASLSTIVNGYQLAGFFCAPTPTCSALGIRNSCAAMLAAPGSPHVTACCCDYYNNCNAENYRIRPSPYTPATNRPPIACWTGLGVNDNIFYDSGRYTACQGSCGALTFRTAMADSTPLNVTIYSCDPTAVCPLMGLQNSCGDSPTGVISGCCCDWNDCINIPQRQLNPYPLPATMNCFVGVSFNNGTAGTTTIGGAMQCNGQCGSIVTVINGLRTYGYYCAPQSVCSAFDIWNECTPRYLDNQRDRVDICCCNNNDLCNIQMLQPNITVPTAPGPARRRTPISCYAGLNFQLGSTTYNLSDSDQYMSCFGDCASVTYNSFANGTNFAATIFSCDPVSLCQTLNIQGSCGNISSSNGQGITGCCCNWNDCINKNNGTVNPRQPKDDLQCFVGLQIQNGSNSSPQIAGSTMPCNGECAAINTVFNGYNTWAFMCTASRLCDIFDTDRECGNYTTDSGYIQTCCCSQWDNCNLREHNIPVPPVSPSTIPTNTTPLACYTGLALNGTVQVSTNRYMSCFGNCAQVTYQSTLAGSGFGVTFFSCDPVTLCNTFAMNNSCVAYTDGNNTNTQISACCCDFNDCIDTSMAPFRPKPNPNRVKDNLQCFVGMQLQGNPQNASSRTILGSSMPCNGECGAIMTHFGTYDLWAFLCTPEVLCNIYDPTRKCGTVNMDMDGDFLEVCCCGGRDNCNVYGHGFPAPSPIPTIDTTTAPLACYAGAALNGKVLTDGDRFMACQGDCAAITYSSRWNGNRFSATVFSCDPATLCGFFNISNNCGFLQNGGSNGTSIVACCCGWNDCIDRTDNGTFAPLPVPHWHKDDLMCFVGIASIGQGPNSTSYIGGSMPCNGDCMSVESAWNGVKTVGFFCGTDATCDYIDPTRGCSFKGLDRGEYLQGCCCGDTDNCNSAIYGLDPGRPVNTTGVPVLACLQGLRYNGTVANSTSFLACQGDCAALSFASTVGGVPFDLTMFMCDPVNMCRRLGLQQSCNVIRPGNSTTTAISGCCCDWNDCLDPQTLKIRPYPLPSSVNCFVGLSILNSTTKATTTYGGSMSCDGQCGSLVTRVNGYTTYGYYCAPQAICSAFDVWQGCTTRHLDRNDTIDVCCCNQNDNCNVNTLQPDIVIPTPSGPNVRRTPIACYAGLTFFYQNTNYNLSDSDKYMSCFGDCASITYNTAAAGANFSATMFTCDPVYICSSLGMSNKCTNIVGDIGNGITGCCCNWDDCINKNRPAINPRPHKDDLQCFVGLQLQSNSNDPNSRYLTGSTMSCDGECAAISTRFNGLDSWAFLCTPQRLCDVFDSERTCGDYPLDGGNNLRTCCCAAVDNCNLRIHNISVPTVVPSISPTGINPLACYSGVATNGQLFSEVNRYMSCLGDCGQITFASSTNGNQFNVTVFSCDPVSLCQGFGLANSCNTVNNGTTTISGCCCNFNDCFDKNTFKPKPNPNRVKDDLSCFGGLQLFSDSANASSGYLSGSSLPCNGECAAIGTKFNGVYSWAYMCTPPSLCDYFDPTRQCGDFPLDGGSTLTTCCCGSTDNCNLAANNQPVPSVIPTSNPTGIPPLACYAGVGMNGTVYSAQNRYMACQGNCAQVTYSASVAGRPFSVTMFSCDPVTLCQSFRLTNQCNTIGNGSTLITGCCCNFNDCIDLTTFQVKALPTAAPTQSTAALSLVFSIIIAMFVSLF